MNYLFRLFFFVSFCYLLACTSTDKTNNSPTSQRPNVLFIAIDDLRPQLNCYGKQYMHTPHLDQLAKAGHLFENHYVQVPTCGASRYSLLMGQYPDSVQLTSNDAIRDYLPQAQAMGKLPMPQVFKANGYYTACLGKISHYVDGKIYSYDGQGDGRLEMPNSWDTVWGPTDKWGTAWNAFFAYPDGSNRNTRKKQVRPTDFTAQKDNDLPDGLIAERAIAELQRLKTQETPFFLGVGFFKPHLPFVAPEKYWDLYEGKDLPMPPMPDMPAGVSPVTVHGSGEFFGGYKIQPEKGGAGIRLSDDYTQYLRKAYYASVSYVDAQVGKVIDALKATGLDKNTIVVVWGDHGWMLGDYTMWGKHSLYERALKSAFIIKTPTATKPSKVHRTIVETVDIYPTLLDLCSLSPNPSLAGTSLLPLLNNSTAYVAKPAISFWRNGYSIRTPQYRLSKYKIGTDTFAELYDHAKDPEEIHNVAQVPEYKNLLQTLDEQLQQQAPTNYWQSLR